MGLDYSYKLILKRQDIWKLLEGVARLSSPTSDQTSVLFHDHTLKLPFEPFASTPGQLFFDDEPNQLDFMTCLDFTPDNALAEYAERYGNQPQQRSDGRLAVSIGYIYLTVATDLIDIGAEPGHNLIGLTFTAATSNMSILFCESDSIRNAMIGLLESYEGLCGILDREESAELIWWRGRPVSVELPHAYLDLAEIENLVPPGDGPEGEPTSPSHYCLACGNEFLPISPDETLCPLCSGELSAPPDRPEAPEKTTVEPSPAEAPATAFCIVHGGEFTPSSPDELVCPDCKRSLEPSSSAGQISEESRQPEEESQPGEEPDEWHPGEALLDTYTVIKRLGKGGMGAVYRVHHLAWDIDLAVKSPHQRIYRSQAGRDAYVGEAEAWIDLGLHPHIVTCYYVRAIDGVPRLFAELVEGGSLHDWIQERRITTPEQALDIAIQFAWGLAYAHEQGLVHRDVKPANALMTLDGTLKVTDFGLVKAGKGMSPAYASPEQAEAQHAQVTLSPQTDIWSWGLSVLEIFAGRAFWVNPIDPNQAWGQTAPQALKAYLSGDVEDPAIEAMPDGLAELLRKCFQTDPAQRPTGLAAVADQLIKLYTDVAGVAYLRTLPKAAELLADSLNNKALSMLDLSREEDAVQLWSAALKENPAHCQANLNLLVYRWRRAEITDDEMLTHLDQLANTKMDDPAYWKAMVLIHAERGDEELLKSCFERAKRLLPDLSAPAAKNSLTLGNTLAGHTKQVFALGSHPNGQVLVSGASDETIRLWDMKSGQCFAEMSGAGFVTSLAISADGLYLASGSSDRTIRVWDISRRKMVKQLSGHSDVVTSLAFSSDSQQIISGSLDGTARVWQRSTGTCSCTYSEHQHWVVSLLVVKEEDLVLSAGRDQTVRLWHYRTGKTERVYERPRSPRKAEYGHLALKSNKVLWAGYDKMCLWDYPSASLLMTFKSSEESGAMQPFVDGDLRDDGLLAVTIGNEGEYRLWETGTGRCLRTAASKEPSWRALFLPDGGLVGGVRNVILHWRMMFEPDLKLFQYQLSIPESGAVALERQTKLRSRLAEARKYQDDGLPEKALQVLRSLQSEAGYAHNDEVLAMLAKCIKKGQKTKLRECWTHSTYQLGLREGTGGIQSLRFSPDSSILAAGHQDGSIGVFDVAKRRPGPVLERHIGAAASLVFIPPHGLLSLSKNGDLILWNLSDASGKIITTTLDPNQGAHLSVHLAETGQYLVVQGLGGYSRIPLRLDRLAPLPARQYRPLVTRATPDIRLPVVMKDTLAGYEFQSAASPDGTMFTSSLGDSRYGQSAHPVFVWQITPGSIRMAHKLLGHVFPVPAMAFSGDQQCLMSADLGGNIHIWSLHNDQCNRTIRNPNSQFTALAVSPDGRCIMAGDTDGTLFVWTVEGELLLSNQSHRGAINTVTFAPDGRFAASGGFDNQIRIWEFDWEVNFPRPADWDDGALPYLKIFLTRHTPLDPVERIPRGKPVWTPDDFNQLLDTLSRAGFGWLRKEGVYRKLEEMAKQMG